MARIEDQTVGAASRGGDRGLRKLLSVCAAWVDRRELAFVAVAAVLLIFPGRWAVVGLTLLALTWLARRAVTGQWTIATNLDVPIAILVGMTLIGLWASPYPAISVPKFWGIVLGVALYYTTANHVARRASMTGVVEVACWGILALCLVSLFGTEWERDRIVNASGLYRLMPRIDLGLPGGGVPRPSTLFGPREVGATVASLLPLPLTILLSRHASGSVRKLALCAVGACAVVLLISQTLLGVAGALVATTFIMAVQRRRRAAVLTGAITATAALLLLALDFGAAWSASGFLTHLDLRLSSSLADRVVRWGWALRVIRDVPFTGVGLNAFDPVLANLYPDSLQHSGFFHAHQLVLQTASDVGIPGLAALLWIFVAFGYAARTVISGSTESTSRVVALGLAAAVISFGTFGLMDAITLGAKPGAALWVMLGTVSGLAARQGMAPRESLRRRLLAPISVAVVLAIVVGFFLRGMWFLDTGTIHAHKALAEYQSGSGDAPHEVVLARQDLGNASRLGFGSAHSIELLSALDRVGDGD